MFHNVHETQSFTEAQAVLVPDPVLWSPVPCPNLAFVICLCCCLHEHLNSVNDNGCFHSMPKRPHIQPDFESESGSLMFTCSPVFTCRSVTQLPSGLWKNSFLWWIHPLWSHTCIGWLGFWRTLSASPALEAFACSCVCDFIDGVFIIFCFYNFQISKMLLSLAPSPLSLLIIATLLKVSTSHSFFPSKCPAFPPQQNFDWGKFAADTWYKKL